MKSGTWPGSTPYRSRTSAGPIRASSETPFTGWRTVVRSLTSWNASRSEVATSVVAAARLLLGDRGGEEVVRLVARLLAGDEARAPRRAPAGGRAARAARGRRRGRSGRRGTPRAGRSARRRSPTRPSPCAAARTPRGGAGSSRSRRSRPRACPGAAHRLRQRVVGAVGERVAVDGEQRAAHSAA